MTSPHPGFSLVIKFCSFPRVGKNRPIVFPPLELFVCPRGFSSPSEVNRVDGYPQLEGRPKHEIKIYETLELNNWTLPNFSDV